MAQRITRKMVERAFELFANEVAPPKGERWLLCQPDETGDQFSVVSQCQSGAGDFKDPLGVGGLGTTEEAFWALHAMASTAKYLRRREEA